MSLTYQQIEAKDRLPQPQLLKQLDTSPEVAAAVEATRRRLGLRTAHDLLRAEEELKLQYYYGGRDVACLDTPAGRLVLAVGTPVIEDLPRVLQSLSPAERRQVTILSPEPWEERTASTPSVTFDEA